MNALDLPPTTDSVPVARRFVQARMQGDTDVDTAALLVSEVVTNAILHARTGVHLTVDDRGSVVHIEVRDGSPVLPRVHAFSPASATGRGLRLLDRLATRWGVQRDPITGGKVVWFEVGASTDATWDAFAEDFAGEEWADLL